MTYAVGHLETKPRLGLLPDGNVVLDCALCIGIQARLGLPIGLALPNLIDGVFGLDRRVGPLGIVGINPSAAIGQIGAAL